MISIQSIAKSIAQSAKRYKRAFSIGRVGSFARTLEAGKARPARRAPGRWLATAWLLAGVVVVAPVRAQTGSGGITGTVLDQSGAVVPQTAVRVVNEDSGSSVETVSNDGGLYRVTSLVPGNYRVEARKEGFEQFVRTGLVVTTGQVVSVELTLAVGAASEVVTVEVAAPLTETQSVSTGQLISRQMVEVLPMPNRAASSLVALAPGVAMIDPGQGAENYPVFSVAGGRGRNQHFSLDGGNATNASGLTRPMQMTSLPMDAMQEFRVSSNNYSAEYGHSAGGVISLTTRSGTNELHGSVFEFLRNNVLDARNFFATREAAAAAATSTASRSAGRFARTRRTISCPGSARNRFRASRRCRRCRRSRSGGAIFPDCATPRAIPS